MRKIITSLLIIATFWSSAQVLWYGDPSKNYLKSFYRLSRETGETGTVSTANDPVHGKVWKLNKPKGEKRNEFARTEGTENRYTPKEGDLLYVGWRMKTNIITAGTPNGFAVFQWKSNNTHSQNYPFIMGYNGKELTLAAYDAGGTCGQACKRELLLSYDVPENTWVSIVLGVKVSKNGNNGYLECWINGVPQNLKNGGLRFKHRTLDDNGNYCKWGTYNENARPYNIDAFLDEMRIGTTLSSVMDPLTGGSTPTNTPPTVSVTSPNNDATFELGQTISLGASASDSDGSVAKVNFKVNGSYYSTDPTGPSYTGTFTPTEVGTYVLSARAFDDKNAAMEKSVTVTVTGPKDCNGTPGGTASNDDCGICSGGTTGIPVNSCNICETVFASSDDGNVPVNVLDGNLETRWSAEGTGEFIEFCLDEETMINSVSLAFFKGDVRTTTFDLEYSLDGIDYTKILSNMASSGTTLDMEKFSFDPVNVKKLRITGKGNSDNAWNSISEVEWAELITNIKNADANSELVIYPNPSASGVFHLSLSRTWEVHDISGRIVLQGKGTHVDMTSFESGVYHLSSDGEAFTIMK